MVSAALWLVRPCFCTNLIHSTGDRTGVPQITDDSRDSWQHWRRINTNVWVIVLIYLEYFFRQRGVGGTSLNTDTSHFNLEAIYLLYLFVVWNEEHIVIQMELLGLWLLRVFLNDFKLRRRLNITILSNQARRGRGNAPQMKKPTWMCPPQNYWKLNFCYVHVSCIKFLPPKVKGKGDIAPQVNVSSYVAVSNLIKSTEWD